jgi:transposase
MVDEESFDRLSSELSRLLAENELLRSNNARLLADNVRLVAEVDRLASELGQSRQSVAGLGEKLVGLEGRISLFEGRSDDNLPPFVKPNRPKSSRSVGPRKKRDPKHNRARRREEPTRRVEHDVERCSKCACKLGGRKLSYRRQVIELPPPQPVEITEHEVYKRFCPACGQWEVAHLDLSGQVLGSSRMGVRIASLVAFLRNVLRLPVRLIRDYLGSLHRLTVSIGEIVVLLEQVYEATKPTVAKLKAAAQTSRILHADETGWREDGRNGYIWSFSTPGTDSDAKESKESVVRYYEYDSSRGQSVVRRILGNQFHGHLVSDFYCGYNDYGCKKQRCWTHLLRDLKKLKEKNESHPNVSEAIEWAQSVRALYDEARSWLAESSDLSPEAREREYVSLVGRMHELGLRHARDKTHPCWALAKRVLRHEDELFQFVLVPGLDATNNLAERSVRPLVVVRKISGGSRSAKGSKVRMALASLFETWKARHLNPFNECLQLLSQPSLQSTTTLSPTTA